MEDHDLIYRFQPTEPAPLLENHLNLGGASPGGSIAVNSRYLVRDGRPWVPVMGEYHFSRDDPARWRRELAKMKAGGITIVASYLFWIYHEETEGVFDFTGANDVRRFVLLCKEAGLDVLLRIGPWVHGECRNGGFPDWLQHAGYPLRCNDERYLAKVHRWYGQIFAQVQGLLCKDGGNIVGVQLDNEFTWDASHLATLKTIAREVGFDVPLYTVTGWAGGSGAKIPLDEVLPCFGGYPEAPWEPHRDPLPPSPHWFFHPVRNDGAIGSDLTISPALLQKADEDGWRLPCENYPYVTCELGGGVQVTHHRRPIVRAMDVYAIAVAKLGSGSNLPGYYMFHGGTHRIGKTATQESRATGYPNDYPVLSYDFQAPLSEYGEVRESYRLFNLLHLFLADFGESFAPTAFRQAEHPPARDDAVSLRYAMRATDDGTAGFVFVNHYERLRPLADVTGAVFDTGTVRFPPVDIKGETAFFLPFHMALDGETLTYATAQPLCRVGSAFFFTALPGIPAEYRFADGETVRPAVGTQSSFMKNSVRIVTLSWDEARFARKLDGALWLGNGCDLYALDGAIHAAEDGVFRCLRWEGDGFAPVTVGAPAPELTMEWETLAKAPFAPAFPEELSYGGKRQLTWKRLTVKGEGITENTLVAIDGQPDANRYDVAQVYADGQLIADSFDYGLPWKLPAQMLAGRECFAVFSEPRDDFYREF